MKGLIIKLIAIAFALAAVLSAFHKIDRLKKENTRLKNNQEILLSENQIIMAESQKYKVSDSLNAIRVSALEFTLSEYKRYRNQDLKLIEQLKSRKSDLETVITSQLKTINTLSAKLNDSIRIDTLTNRINALKYFSYKSEWVDVKGCIDLNQDTINLQIKNKEALKVIETVTHRRFLGFLWKTNRIESRQVDVVSKNPNTEITRCEYISIRQ